MRLARDAFGVPPGAAERRPYEAPKVRRLWFPWFFKRTVRLGLPATVTIPFRVHLVRYDGSSTRFASEQNRTFYVPLDWVEAARERWNMYGLGHTLYPWTNEKTGSK